MGKKWYEDLTYGVKRPRDGCMGKYDEGGHWEENKTPVEKAYDVLNSSRRHTSCLRKQRQYRGTTCDDGSLRQKAAVQGILVADTTSITLPTRLWVSPIPVINSALTQSPTVLVMGTAFEARLLYKGLTTNGKFYGPEQVTLTPWWLTQLFPP